MFLDHPIRVISEGSCDPEDWSNDWFDHRNKLHYNLLTEKPFKFSIRILYFSHKSALVRRLKSLKPEHKRLKHSGYYPLASTQNDWTNWKYECSGSDWA